MAGKYRLIWFLLVFVVFSACESTGATITIQTQTALGIALTGFNGLGERTIYQGELAAGGKDEVETTYRGLALLVFTGGQIYPVIVGEKSFTLQITSPNQPPSFAGSDENVFFYNSLTIGDPPTGQYDFALLMVVAKTLLESSHSVKTVKELTGKKKEFYEFVHKHYDSLKHSDMVKRIIAQYFMMHEYVDYHIEGATATDIRDKYQKEVLNGVKSWLGLKTYLSEQEILNYCVSLYYDRAMVTLASLIIDNFRDVAYCSGTEKKTSDFPGNLRITKANGSKAGILDNLKGDKLIAYVSDDCPVSMVETVIKARQLVTEKGNKPIIIAPLQKLSERHFAIARMVYNGNMFFIDDDKWRKENMKQKVKLPLFVKIEDNSN